MSARMVAVGVVMVLSLLPPLAWAAYGVHAALADGRWTFVVVGFLLALGPALYARHLALGAMRKQARRQRATRRTMAALMTDEPPRLEIFTATVIRAASYVDLANGERELMAACDATGRRAEQVLEFRLGRVLRVYRVTPPFSDGGQG